MKSFDSSWRVDFPSRCGLEVTPPSSLVICGECLLESNATFMFDIAGWDRSPPSCPREGKKGKSVNSRGRTVTGELVMRVRDLSFRFVIGGLCVFIATGLPVFAASVEENICAIKSVSPEPCACCQGPVELVEQPLIKRPE